MCPRGRPEAKDVLEDSTSGWQTIYCNGLLRALSKPTITPFVVPVLTLAPSHSIACKYDEFESDVNNSRISSEMCFDDPVFGDSWPT